METGGVGDRLDMRVIGYVVIGPGNRGELPFVQIRDGLGESEVGIKIGIVVAAIFWPSALDAQPATTPAPTEHAA